MTKDDPFDRFVERAAGPRGHVGPQTGCLDAETLARWIDGTLPTIERTAAEAHAADCDRCLAMLAAIAKTEPPAQVEAERSHASWFTVRWLAPLAAVAVVIVAWVIVQNPTERTREVATGPTPPIDAVTAPPSVAAESDLAKQARTGTASVEQQHAPSAAETRRQAPTDALRRADAQGKREAQERLARDEDRAQPTASPQRKMESAAANAVRAPTVITSPDPQVRWRFAGATVERSTDGGATWTPQSAGSEAVLVAGACPAPTVCWIVGQAGTIVLTTDGQTWNRVNFPDPTLDLVRVTARDGASATVTTVDGRTYRTDDAGKTWRVQESSAAAF